jgi:glucokinase
MAAIAAGVDVGGTKIEVVLIDEDGAVLAHTRRATTHLASTPPGAALADEITAALAELVGDDTSLPVGVGLPGMMTRDGLLAYAPNLPSANGANLTTLLRDRRPGSVVVCANDADCAAVAEYHAGAAKGVDDFALVTLGTGIGGGLYANGRLVRGRHGFAGEIGHMVLDPHGPPCPCGGRGCWERYASGSGVGRLAREAAAAGRLPTLVAACGDPEKVRGEDVTKAAAEGLAEALAVIDEVGWWLALGIANLVVVLDVNVVVVGGGLGTVADLLLPPARRSLAGLVEGAAVRGELELRAAHFSAQAGAIGAAFLAHESRP